MDEAWERAVETALEGQADSSSAPRTLTLDGAVKCLQGQLPPPGLLERYQSLEHLSIANVGVSSLEKFPRLRNLQRLILSDNRIAGGLEFLVEAGLDSLRDLDLSNNRIQFLEDLTPLAQLRLASLDLYECPVTRVKDYRSRVFGMIRTLKYLDKMDSDENERPETDEEEEEDEEDEEEEEDAGSGEVDGGDWTGRSVNGIVGSARGDAIVDVDEDEESDADEEETETGARRMEANGLRRGSHHHLLNGFRVAAVGAASIDMEDEEEEEEEDVEDDDDEEEDLVEEIDDEEGEEDDVVEVHDVGDSDEDADGVEDDGEEEVDEEDGDGDEDEEDVEDEGDDGELGSTGRLMSMEGEIDGHEQGEEDENGEIGEEDEQGVEEDREEYEEGDGEDEDEEEDLGTEYLVQPIAQPTGGNDFDAFNEDDEDEVDDDEENNHSNGVLQHLPSSSQPNKGKRDEENKRKRDDEDDDSVEDLRSSKHH